MSQDDLQVLAQLMAAGTVTSVIDRRYGLRDVPQALRYLEAEHARGKVVITDVRIDDGRPPVTRGPSTPPGGPDAA